MLLVLLEMVMENLGGGRTADRLFEWVGMYSGGQGCCKGVGGL